MTVAAPQGLTAGGEGEGGEGPKGGLNLPERLAGLHVMDTRLPLPVAQRQPAPVRGKRQRQDVAASAEGVQWLAGDRIPQDGRAIVAARRDPAAVRGHDHGPDE